VVLLHHRTDSASPWGELYDDNDRGDDQDFHEERAAFGLVPE
jgi:hypothetical protein